MGCKKGISGKVYTDAKCAKEAHSSFNLMEKHVSDTGKCISHKATEEDHAALKTATKDLDAAKKETKTAKTALSAVPKIEVDDATATTDKKVKLVPAAEAFNAHWPELKKEWNAW